LKLLKGTVFAHSAIPAIMIIALLTSIMIFPFQKVLAIDGGESEHDIAAIITASLSSGSSISNSTSNSTQAAYSSSSTDQLTIPEAAKGPTIPPEKGYLVEEIRGGLYWVTDGSYNTMFLVTDEGVVAIDAPPAIGANYLKAIAEVTDKPIKYVIYSHSHLDHIGAAAAIFPENATYIAHEKVAEELRRAHQELQASSAAVVVGNNNSQFPPMQLPAFNVSQLPPIPTETFAQNYTLQIGNQTLELNYHGNNHEEGNIFIYAPAQKTLMLVDIIFPGWVPFPDLALAEDVFGFIKAHDIALSYDFDTFVGGHLTRVGTRDDVQVQREFVRDLINSSNRANQNVAFSEVMEKVGGPTNNLWAIFKTYLDTVAEQCTNEMLPKWQQRLGGAQEFMFSHCWTMAESLRIDPTTKTLQQ
jgi:glyoxylase-like metal-dependent hydrolase (beta-lactamase superfamily II)